MIHLKEICKEIENAARETGAFILKESIEFDINRTESKGINNFVSYVDKEAEKMLVDRLSRLLPEAGFITEEGTSKKSGLRYTWVIDPLDGTTNFIHGTPPVAVSIALLENNEPVAGVVYEVFMDECFYAWKGGKAFLNNREIKVSLTGKVNDALLATGFPYHNFDRIDAYMESLVYFFTHCHGVRRLGSAATDLAYVACGRYDGFYEYNLNPWDVAAGALIIQQAGGKASDFKGGADFLFSREIVATNNNMYTDFLSQVSRFMNVK